MFEADESRMIPLGASTVQFDPQLRFTLELSDLTIVTDNYYSVYENDLKFSDEFKKNEINYKIEWNEWSQCKCDQNGTNGYRTRFGQCFSISKLDIFKYYNHVI